MLGNILAKILAGSAVGYITNYLAIQMLFQEYLKIKTKGIDFSLGGVIIKERQEFERQISRLVESDVIHHKAIDAELRKPAFEQALLQIIENIFEQQLAEAIPDSLHVKDIPALEQSFQQLKTLLGQQLKKEAKPLLEATLNQIQIDEVLSEAQIQHFSARVAKLLEAFSTQAYSFAPVIVALLQSIENQTISEIIPKKIADVLVKNLNVYFDDFHNFLKYNYAVSLENLTQTTAHKADLNLLIQQLSAQAAQRNLAELLRTENLDYLPEALGGHLRELLQSEVSEDIIQTLLKFLISVLKEEKSTLFELLSDELKQTFEQFLAKKLPDLLNTLIPWLRKKKLKLEKLIEEAFNQNVNVVGRVLVALFIGNVGKYVGLEEKIIKLIEEQNTDEIAKRAANYLLEFLKNNSIGEIMQRFNEQKILENLTPVLTKNLHDSVANLRLDNIQNVFDRPIQSFFPEERIAKALTQLKDTALSEFVLEKGVFSPKMDSLLQSRLTKGSDLLWNTPFSKLLPPEKFSGLADSLDKAIKKNISQRKETLQALIRQTLENFSKDKSTLAVLEQLDIQVDSFVIESLENFLQKEFEKIGDDALHTHLQKLAQINGLSQKLGDTLKNYLLQNLPQLMEGRITDLVSDNLAKQPNTRLRDMVKKAMGEELRPLSFFGAILGTITGGLLLGLPALETVGATFAVSGIAYGITGWGTNWLAIRMLFKPYQPIKFWKNRYQLPFTPGVIAKHKGRFAQSMGRFIGDRLLNQDNLQENFAKNQTKLSTLAKDVLSKNEHATLHNLLVNNQEKISKSLTEAFLQALSPTEKPFFETQIKPFLVRSEHKTLANLNLANFSKKITEYLANPTTTAQLKNWIEKQLHNQVASEKSLNDLLGEQQKENLYAQLSQWLGREVENFSKKLTPAQVWTWVDWQQVAQRAEGFLQNNLAQILNTSQEDKLKEEVFQFLNQKIQSSELKDRLYQFIDQKLNAEFSPDKNLKDFFGGRVMELLEQNLNNVLKQVIELGLAWTQKNRESIAERVYEDAYKENAMVWTYKNSIKNTIYSLVDKGIPDFFEKEFDSLKLEIKGKVEDLGNSPLHNTKFIALDNESLKNKIEQILQNAKLLHKIRQLTNIILEERIFKIPLQKLLIDDAPALINHLKSVLEPEMQTILTHLTKKLEDPDQRQALLKPAIALVWEIAFKHLGSISIKNFLKGIAPEAIDKVADNLSKLLLNNPVLDNEKSRLITEVLAFLQKQPYGRLASWQQLENDLCSIWKKLEHSEDLHLQLRAVLQQTIQATLPLLNEALQTKSKDFVIEVLSQSVFKSLEKNILSLINSLSFKEIVVREIGNMHAQELEKLFYGFASRYFKYLIGYGFIFGIIFGLAIDAGLLGFLGLLAD